LGLGDVGRVFRIAGAYFFIAFIATQGAINALVSGRRRWRDRRLRGVRSCRRN